MLKLCTDGGDDNEEFWGVLGGFIEVTKQSDDAEEENEVWIYKYAPLLRLPPLPSLSSLSLSFLP